MGRGPAGKIAYGRLLQPFGLAVPSGKAYWLILPDDRPMAARARAFRDWILAESAEARADGR